MVGVDVGEEEKVGTLNGEKEKVLKALNGIYWFGCYSR